MYHYFLFDITVHKKVVAIYSNTYHNDDVTYYCYYI